MSSGPIARTCATRESLSTSHSAKVSVDTAHTQSWNSGGSTTPFKAKSGMRLSSALGSRLRNLDTVKTWGCILAPRTPTSPTTKHVSSRDAPREWGTMSKATSLPMMTLTWPTSHRSQAADRRLQAASRAVQDLRSTSSHPRRGSTYRTSRTVSSAIVESDHRSIAKGHSSRIKTQSQVSTHTIWLGRLPSCVPEMPSIRQQRAQRKWSSQVWRLRFHPVAKCQVVRRKGM